MDFVETPDVIRRANVVRKDGALLSAFKLTVDSHFNRDWNKISASRHLGWVLLETGEISPSNLIK
jgi:hypothetical protein